MSDEAHEEVVLSQEQVVEAAVAELGGDTKPEESPDGGADNSGDSGNDNLPDGDAGVADGGDEKKPPVEGDPASDEGKKEEEPAHKKLAYLSRQDKILREKEQKLAAREGSIKEQEAKLEDALGFIARFKEDPFGSLEAQLGPDAYKQYTEKLLKGGKTIADKQYDSVNKRLDDEAAARKKASEDAAAEQAAAIDAQVKEYQGAISDAVKADPILSKLDGAADECWKLAMHVVEESNGTYAPTVEELVEASKKHLKKQSGVLGELFKEPAEEEVKPQVQPAAISQADASTKKDQWSPGMSDEQLVDIALAAWEQSE